MPAPICTKRRFYALWHEGRLGNRPHAWNALVQVFADGWRKPVGIRTLGRTGGKVMYRCPIERLAEVVASWPGTPTFTEPMPDTQRTIQGEVTRNEGGLELTYQLGADENGLPMMREAMKHPLRATGLVALEILRHFLWPSSFDDLMELLDLYPDHVIEFGAHDVAVGVLPCRNTVVWEVRHY